MRGEGKLRLLPCRLRFRIFTANQDEIARLKAQSPTCQGADLKNRPPLAVKIDHSGRKVASLDRLNQLPASLYQQIPDRTA